MNLPPVVMNLLAKWQTYTIIAGVVAAVLGATYLKGHSDGVDQTDNKWKAAIADAKDKVVKVDTIFLPQKPSEGTFSPQAIVDAAYQKKVTAVIDEARNLAVAYGTRADSLQAINTQLEARLELSLEPKMIHLATTELGDLILKYYPADSSANVYRYQPPPEKVVTVYQEKLVMEPRSDWETAAHYVIGVAVGIVAGYAIGHH